MLYQAELHPDRKEDYSSKLLFESWKGLVADVGVEPTCLGYEPSLGPIQVIRDKLGELHPRKFIKWNGLVPTFVGIRYAPKRVNGRSYLYPVIRFQITNGAFCKEVRRDGLPRVPFIIATS